MANERANPFDLSDFEPAPRKKTVLEEGAIRDVAEANRFTSREAPMKPLKAVEPTVAEPPATVQTRRPNRHRTGRNVQFNPKVTQQTLEKAHELADRLSVTHRISLGELVERALAALERELNNVRK